MISSILYARDEISYEYSIIRTHKMLNFTPWFDLSVSFLELYA